MWYSTVGVVPRLSVWAQQQSVWFWCVAAAGMLALYGLKQLSAPCKRKGVPSPPYWPIVGNAPEAFKNLHRFNDWTQDVTEQFGYKTWAMYLPGHSPHWRFTDPACVKFLLKDRFDDFGRSSPGMPDYARELLGKGLPNVDGPEWRKQRKVASHMFSLSNLRHHMFSTFVKRGTKLLAEFDAAAAAEHTQSAAHPKPQTEPHARPHTRRHDASETAGSSGGGGVPGVSGSGDAHTVFDAQDVFFRFTMDAILDIAFGTKQTDDGREQLSESIDAAQSLSMQRFFRFIPWFRIVRGSQWDRQERELAEHLTRVNTFIHGIVRKRIETANASRTDGGAGVGVGSAGGGVGAVAVGGDKKERFKDMITAFIQYSHDQQDLETRAVDYLRDITMTFMIAGRDTTAVGMTWVLYEWCRHPECHADILQEIKEHLPAKEESADQKDVTDGAEEITEETVQRLVMLRCFIYEAHRLHPPVPYDVKFANKDMVFPDGTQVRAHDSCGYPIQAINVSTKTWGPDAKAFRPGRFLKPLPSAEPSTQPSGQPTDSSVAAVPTNDERVFHEPSPFVFPTWNAGPRACLGKPMALTEMLYLMSQLLPRYELSLHDGMKHPVECDFSINPKMNGGLRLNVKRRAS